MYELHYQWYQNTTESTSGSTPIAGATNATYVPSIQDNDCYYYYCIVTNVDPAAVDTSGTTTTSGIAKITVVIPPQNANSSGQAGNQNQSDSQDQSDNQAQANNSGVPTASTAVTSQTVPTSIADANITAIKPATFASLPKTTKIAKVTYKKRKLIVKFKKNKKVSGIVIQYATNKNFKKAKTITLAKNKAFTYTSKKLKAKTTYYVRFRTYKIVQKKKNYSNWYGNVKVK